MRLEPYDSTPDPVVVNLNLGSCGASVFLVFPLLLLAALDVMAVVVPQDRANAPTMAVVLGLFNLGAAFVSFRLYSRVASISIGSAGLRYRRKRRDWFVPWEYITDIDITRESYKRRGTNIPTYITTIRIGGADAVFHQQSLPKCPWVLASARYTHGLQFVDNSVRLARLASDRVGERVLDDTTRLVMAATEYGGGRFQGFADRSVGKRPVKVLGRLYDDPLERAYDLSDPVRLWLSIRARQWISVVLVVAYTAAALFWVYQLFIDRLPVQVGVPLDPTALSVYLILMVLAVRVLLYPALSLTATHKRYIEIGSSGLTYYERGKSRNFPWACLSLVDVSLVDRDDRVRAEIRMAALPGLLDSKKYDKWRTPEAPPYTHRIGLVFEDQDAVDRGVATLKNALAMYSGGRYHEDSPSVQDQPEDDLAEATTGGWDERRTGDGRRTDPGPQKRISDAGLGQPVLTDVALSGPSSGEGGGGPLTAPYRRRPWPRFRLAVGLLVVASLIVAAPVAVVVRATNERNTHPLRPSALVIDKAGNLYVINQQVVEKVAPDGDRTVVANSDFDKSGRVARNPFTMPVALAIDHAENLYIADLDSVRKITPHDRRSTVGKFGNHFHTTAIAVDSGGNVYATDGDTVKEITPRGVSPVKIIDATGNISKITTLAVDSADNLYIGALNGEIVRRSPDGTLSIVAGNNSSWGFPIPGPATSSPVAPVAMTFDAADNLYVADYNRAVEKITPDGVLSIVAGDGGTGLPVPGQARRSPLGKPSGVGVDSAGNVFVSGAVDDKGWVLKTAPDGTLSVAAGQVGTPVASTEFRPQGSVDGVATDGAGNLTVIDSWSDLHFDVGGYVLWRIDSGGRASVVAGNGGRGAPVPGPAVHSLLGTTGAVAVDQASRLYIADNQNALLGYVEAVDADGVLSIVAGNGQGGAPVPGPATASPLGPLDAITVDSTGNIYVADRSNALVEKINPDGVLSIVAGNGHRGIPVPGPATASPLGGPGGGQSFSGLAVDKTGNLYIGDAHSAVVEKVSPDGVLSIVAGNGTPDDPVPGPAASSSLDPMGLAIDSADNLYVTYVYGVAKITPDGTLSVVAGNGDWRTPVPGRATSSPLDPYGITIDSADNLYVAYDSGVVKITPDGTLSITVAPAD